MKTKVNPFFVPWTKIISSHTEWCIGKYLGVCTVFFKTFTWYLKFMLYHTVIQIVQDINLDLISMFMPKLCFSPLKWLQQMSLFLSVGELQNKCMYNSYVVTVDIKSRGLKTQIYYMRSFTIKLSVLQTISSRCRQSLEMWS